MQGLFSGLIQCKMTLAKGAIDGESILHIEFLGGSRQGEGLFIKVFSFPNSHDGDSDVIRMSFYGTLKILMATS